MVAVQHLYLPIICLKSAKAGKILFGSGKTVDFPVGQAAKGNPGVAGIIAQTPYSLGYIGSE